MSERKGEYQPVFVAWQYRQEACWHLGVWCQSLMSPQVCHIAVLCLTLFGWVWVSLPPTAAYTALSLPPCEKGNSYTPVQVPVDVDLYVDDSMFKAILSFKDEEDNLVAYLDIEEKGKTLSMAGGLRRDQTPKISRTLLATVLQRGCLHIKIEFYDQTELKLFFHNDYRPIYLPVTRTASVRLKVEEPPHFQICSPLPFKYVYTMTPPLIYTPSDPTTTQDPSRVQEQAVTLEDSSYVEEQAVTLEDSSRVQEQAVTLEDSSYVDEQIVTLENSSFLEDKGVTLEDSSRVEDIGVTFEEVVLIIEVVLVGVGVVVSLVVLVVTVTATLGL